MAYSSIMGADTAPAQPGGRDSKALGPSDNSDSGSDAAGTPEAHADSDSVGTGERGSVTLGVEGREGSDILPDHVVELGGNDRPLASGEEFPLHIDVRDRAPYNAVQSRVCESEIA